MTQRRRLGFRVALAATGVLVAALGSAIVLTVSVARLAVTPSRAFRYDTRIRGVAEDGSTITLQRTMDSVVPGRYSFWLKGEQGHLRLGEIVSVTSRDVTRRIERVDFGDPSRARVGRIGSWYYLRPEELGLAVHSVELPTELGTNPAWLFPAEEHSGHWAIHVHGRGTKRQESLRAVPVFAAAGYTSLLVSYRNDGNAPASADARYGLGATEWHDVDAAIAYALAHGATDVVLVGWSMGGAISLQTVTQSTHADSIRGMMLDSPVINWVDVLTYQAKLLHLPRLLTSTALAALGSPRGGRVTGLDAPIDLALLDFVARADSLRVPVLLMHSDDDGYVPADASHALAAARSDIVTFVPFSVARHTKLWNYDDARWNTAVSKWLAQLSTD